MINDIVLNPFFELTPDLVCVVNREGYFKKINHAVSEKLGYSKEELMASPVATFIHPDDKEITAAQRVKLLSGKPLINFQNRYVSKSGSVIWLHWTSVYFPEQELVFAIAKDVTTLKLTEKEIQEKYEKFKSAAGHFKKRIERDRKYIAVELHEELAQLAAVTKMNLDWLTTQEHNLSEEGRKKAEQAVVLTNMLINGIRRISFSMSPGMLNDLGLEETLRWQCNELTRLSGIHCTLQGNCNEASLTTETTLDIFRICQEAMHNILYHSEATTALVEITEEADKVSFKISDNGKGFNLTENINAQGLVNMRERASSANGNLLIHSEVGKGTEIILELRKDIPAT